MLPFRTRATIVVVSLIAISSEAPTWWLWAPVSWAFAAAVTDLVCRVAVLVYATIDLAIRIRRS